MSHLFHCKLLHSIAFFQWRISFTSVFYSHIEEKEVEELTKDILVFFLLYRVPSNKYLLNACYVPDTILAQAVSRATKLFDFSPFIELIFLLLRSTSTGSVV